MLRKREGYRTAAATAATRRPEGPDQGLTHCAPHWRGICVSLKRTMRLSSCCRFRNWISIRRPVGSWLEHLAELEGDDHSRTRRRLKGGATPKLVPACELLPKLDVEPPLSDHITRFLHHWERLHAPQSPGRDAGPSASTAVVSLPTPSHGQAAETLLSALLDRHAPPRRAEASALRARPSASSCSRG